MVRYSPKVPKRFGQIAAGHDLIFTCRHCGRPRLVELGRALEAWGRLGIIEEVAGRTLCGFERCAKRGRRGHRVELAPLKANLRPPKG